jgi:hypothetical protein
MNLVTQSCTRVPWGTVIVGGMLMVCDSNCCDSEPTPPPPALRLMLV